MSTRLENLLDLARKRTDESEVFWVKEEAIPVEFENDKLKSIDSKFIEGMGLRVIKNGRFGFSSTTDLRNVSLLVENALSSAQFGEEARFQFPAEVNPTPVKLFDEVVMQYSLAEAVKSGEEVIERIHSYNPDIRCSVGIERSKKEVGIFNSRGLRLRYQKTILGGGISGILASEKDILSVYEEKLSCRRGDIKIFELAEELIKKFRYGERIVKLPSGKMPVIFTPRGIFALLFPLIVGLNGRLVQKGASPLSQYLGKKIFDPRLSIFDVGALDFQPHSSPVDDEGVPTGKTPLVESGVVTNFIYDLQTATRMGVKTTGNAKRGFIGLPSPDFHNIVISPGDVAYQDMIKNLKEGLLVDQVMGAGQSNILGGEFSVNVDLAFKIEGGEIVGRVKNTMVAGNVVEALSLISALSREVEINPRVLPWGLSTPAFLFEKLSVASQD